MGSYMRKLAALEENLGTRSQVDLSKIVSLVEQLEGAGDSFTNALYDTEEGPLDGSLERHLQALKSVHMQISSSYFALMELLEKKEEI